LSIIARGVGIFSIGKYFLAVIFAGVKDNKNVALPSTVESDKLMKYPFGIFREKARILQNT
jgi:hypothetical protein